MRTFEHFNASHNDICPICGTDEDKETLLIPILGTEKGNIAEAIQVHVNCLMDNLRYVPYTSGHIVSPCSFKPKR